MSNESLSPQDVERCQEIILNFMPVPVTEQQKQALAKYRAGEQDGVRTDSSINKDQENCLVALLAAKGAGADAIKYLREAAELAVKYAGAADGSELDAKLGEVLPEHFG